jgi:hypothetical protein
VAVVIGVFVCCLVGMSRSCPAGYPESHDGGERCWLRIGWIVLLVSCCWSRLLLLWRADVLTSGWITKCDVLTLLLVVVLVLDNTSCR